MPSKLTSRNAPKSQTPANVISLSSKLATKQKEADQVQRFLEYVSWDELQLLTPIRVSKPAGALQWLAARFGIECIAEYLEGSSPAQASEPIANVSNLNAPGSENPVSENNAESLLGTLSVQETAFLMAARSLTPETLTYFTDMASDLASNPLFKAKPQLSVVRAASRKGGRHA